MTGKPAVDNVRQRLLRSHRLSYDTVQSTGYVMTAAGLLSQPSRGVHPRGMASAYNAPR